MPVLGEKYNLLRGAEKGCSAMGMDIYTQEYLQSVKIAHVHHRHYHQYMPSPNVLLEHHLSQEVLTSRADDVHLQVGYVYLNQHLMTQIAAYPSFPLSCQFCPIQR